MYRLSLIQAQLPLMFFPLTYKSFSPIQCNQRISSASSGGPSIGNPVHAQLADTSLVSPSDTDVRGATDNSPSSQTPPPTTRETRETTSSSQNPNATSMPLVREQLQKLGLSPDTIDTIDILMASWRKSTGKQYTSYSLDG